MALGWLEWAIVGLLLIVPVLWKNNKAFKFNVKVGFYFFFMMLSGFLFLPFIFWRPKSLKNILVVRDFWNFTLRIFNWDVEVRNREHIEYMKPAVIVSNHQSAMDMIAMMQAMPERTTALAKKELLYTGAWGLSAWLCGLVFVDRLNPEKARSTMSKTVKHLHDWSVKIWIFPEGTRKLNGKINTFKKGAFHLAVQAQVPIIPVVNSSYLPFYDPDKKLFEAGKIITTVLPPISTEGLTEEDVNDLTERVRSEMTIVFDKISHEVVQDFYTKGKEAKS